MIRKRYIGKVEKGVLIFKNQESYNKELARLEGKEIELSIGEKRNSRSLRQNAYLWGVPNDMISRETGMDIDTTHEFLKQNFAPRKRITIKGKETVVAKGTSQMDTIEFSEYIERIIRFAAEELNMYIPLPDEVDIDYLD